jgi:predicted nucleotidyltransferase
MMSLENVDNVRLDLVEREALVHALADVTDEVYLFGSRTNPTGRGGDVDIVVFSEQESFELSRKIARRFFLKCEEKIDVLVFDQGHISDEQKAFLDTLRMVKIQ